MGRAVMHSLEFILILFVSVIFYSMTNGSPAVPMGRTCSDIRCLGSEVCVMEQGSCDYVGRCHKYPTCRLPKSTSLDNCYNVRCPPGQFCALIEDRCSWKPCPSRPTCISSNSSVYIPTQRPW